MGMALPRPCRIFLIIFSAFPEAHLITEKKLSENIKAFSSYCNIAKNGRGPATPLWVLRHARQNFQN